MRFPYIILIGIAVVSVWMLNGRYYQEELTLFGFAETKETEINLNFSVMVDELNVLSGQSVKEGQLLLRAKRLDSDIKFEDQEMKISEINAKKRIWRSEQEGRLKTLESSYLKKMGDVNTQIDAINNKLAQQKELYEGLDYIEANQDLPANHPSKMRIAAYEEERRNIEKRYQLDLTNLQSIIAKGTKDDDETIKRLRAEYKHVQDNKEIVVDIVAPTDGLIGNVHCKEGEHITDYRTLISFYEPNPTLVKAYVHEDYLVKVDIGDEFKISSIKDITQTYTGKVVGLGSRIVEIPARMRKVPEFKTYGREVVIRLPAKSKFLQNEKLILIGIKS